MNNHVHNTYKSAFFVVPTYIPYLPGMTLNFLKVYETIFQFWNHNKACYLSEKSLIERTSVCRSEVYAALMYFEKHGEVKRIRKGLKRFLVRPEKIIETDCTHLNLTSEIADIGTNINQTSEIADVNVRDSGRITSEIADHNTKKRTKEFKKTSTTSVSSSFIITEKLDKTYLEYKVDTDPRSDEVYLKHCKHHIENNSDPSLHINQRRSGIKEILRKCFENKEYFESRDYLDPEEKRIKKQEEEARAKAKAEAQDRLHLEKMKKWEEEQKARKEKQTQYQEEAQAMKNIVHAMGSGKGFQGFRSMVAQLRGRAEDENKGRMQENLK
jgi:hypothetical protein